MVTCIVIYYEFGQNDFREKTYMSIPKSANRSMFGSSTLSLDLIYIKKLQKSYI